MYLIDKTFDNIMMENKNWTFLFVTKKIVVKSVLTHCALYSRFTSDDQIHFRHPRRTWACIMRTLER